MKDNKVSKGLEYYLSLNYSMKIPESLEEGMYFVEFPDLPGCMAHGTTYEEAIELAKEIKKDWIETALSLGRIVPEPKKEEDFSGRITFRVSPAEHKSLTVQAEAEGRSLNQFLRVLCLDRGHANEFDNLLCRLEKVTDKQENLKSEVKTMVLIQQGTEAVKEQELIGEVTSSIQDKSWFVSSERH